MSVRDLADEKFVSVTTYRRSGAGVATPVWVVGDGDDVLAWTGAGTGKVKRLRNDDRVELAPCSRRGSVAPDAPRLSASATVSADDGEVERVERLLRGKYGVEYVVVTGVERLLSAVRRRPAPRVVLRISDRSENH